MKKDKFAEQSKLTTKFLLELSKHLSGRKDCNGVNYKVVVGRCSIIFLPPKTVCPDKYTRKKSMKVSVLDHVIRRHFYSELCGGLDEFGNTVLIAEKLLPGTYEYRSSIDNKSRRWIRVC